MDKEKSLKLWNKYGEYILTATAYQDRVISEGHDCIIKDMDGNELLDMSSGQICALLGHNHPELIRRIFNQVEKILHTGTSFLSPPVFEAAVKLSEITPGNLKKSIFLSTGAEANEYAFRLAKAYTQKDGILAFTKGYAGLTLATTSASNYGKGAHPLVPETYYLLTPDCLNCPVDAQYPECDILCLKVSQEMLKGASEKIAAIIFEPILSAGGMIFPPPEYFKQLKEFSDKLEALLIADEAQTGFGRTGKWFGMEHYEVNPDILVTSKGMGGGFPVSGVITTDAIANEITGKLSHFSSHQSDPVSAAAVVAVIDVIQKENLIEQAAEKGDYLVEKLKEVSRYYSHIANIRGKGLMVGFDVFEDSALNKTSKTLGDILEYACRERGVHLQCVQKNTFRILPPLTITHQEINHFVAVLEEAMKESLAGKYSLNDILSKNPYTRALELKSSKTFRKTLEKVWETSPKYWTSKIKRKIIN